MLKFDRDARWTEISEYGDWRLTSMKTRKIAGKQLRMVSIFSYNAVRSVRDEMIFRVIHPNEVSAKI